MKRNSIATSSLVVLSLLLTAAGAFAQSAARANVPFAFKVGTVQVPAGTYSVKRDLDSNIVMLRNVKTGTAVLALVSLQLASKTTGKLIFHHVGSQYSLTEIWGIDGNPGMVLSTPKGKREREVASGPSNAGNTFEIALK
jgi:hypothetical protein